MRSRCGLVVLALVALPLLAASGGQGGEPVDDAVGGGSAWDVDPPGGGTAAIGGGGGGTAAMGRGGSAIAQPGAGGGGVAGAGGGGEPSGGEASGGGGGDASGDGLRRRAQALMSEGVLLLRRAAFAPALERFRDAHRLYPSPKLLLNIGTTLRVLGRHAEAIAAYERYRVEPGADPERVTEVARLLAKLYPLVAGLTVFVDDDLATARLDGRPLAHLDGSRWMWVEPGEHVLLVERAGRPTVTRVLQLDAGARDNLIVELDRPAPPPSRSRAELRGAAAVIGAVGGAGLAVSAGLGIVALVLDGEAADHCRPEAPSRCDGTGATLGANAHGVQTAAIVGLVTAGTVSGVGLMLYLIAPPAAATAPAEQPGAWLELAPAGATGVALRLGGRF